MSAERVLVRVTDAVLGDHSGHRHKECPEEFRYLRDQRLLVRRITLSDGSVAKSAIPLQIQGHSSRLEQMALAAIHDDAWLRLSKRPETPEVGDPVRCVDLFAGLGGMSLGVGEAARALDRPFQLVFAADTYDLARKALSHNGSAPVRFSRFPVERILRGNLGAPLSWREAALRRELGDVDLLVGGPPCQGHSDLNNHTRRRDPKNRLYLKMARAVDVLEPRHVIVENVPGVAKDDGRVLETTQEHLEERDYRVDVHVLKGEKLGVPQTRHRMFLVASRDRTPRIEQASQQLAVVPRSFEWACHDLSTDPSSGFDTTAVPSKVTEERIEWLHTSGESNLPDSLRPDCHRLKAHRYHSVYGRMWKGRPASTITTGFMVMGQGRFVHPHEPRTLTPHEGARLQFLPDWLRIPHRFRRDYGMLIGNAVPPKMAYVLALHLLR